MLGKTNVTQLPEGAVITDIKDYSWLHVESGIYGNFVKTVYKGGYLVAITPNGGIAYTTDGEVWETAMLEYQDCQLNDIDWDGSRFLLAGCCRDSTYNSDETTALLLTTVDFSAFERIPPLDAGTTMGTETKYYEEYFAIFPENGKYLLLAWHKNVTSSAGASYDELIALLVDPESGIANQAHSTRNIQRKNWGIAKNSSGILLYSTYSNSASLSMVTSNANQGLESISGNTGRIIMSVFECKDTLYYMGLISSVNYNFKKVTNNAETMTMCTGQNFMFTSGVYFDGCEVFINAHSMLVVKKDESIADKTVSDLIEIVPENTMNCITKAFGQLYIFGNQGLIMKSSTVAKDEHSATVQAFTARIALMKANEYTDEKYEALENRVAKLEALMNK